MSDEVSARGVFGGFAADLAGNLTSTATTTLVGGLVAGPVGAAVGAASGDVTQATIRALLSSQDDQIAQMEEMSERLEGRLADLQESVNLMLESPLGEARLELDQAVRARTPERRERDILAARACLFRAYNQTKLHARLSIICQAIAVCFILDNDPEEADRWFREAYSEALASARSEYQRVRREIKRWDKVPTERRKRDAHLRDKEEALSLLRPDIEAMQQLTWDALRFRRSLIRIGVDETTLLKARVDVPNSDMVSEPRWREISRTEAGEPDTLLVGYSRSSRDDRLVEPVSEECSAKWDGDLLAVRVYRPRKLDMAFPDVRYFRPAADEWAAFWRWMSRQRPDVLAVESDPDRPESDPIVPYALVVEGAWALAVEGMVLNHEAAGSGTPPRMVEDMFAAAERLLCAGDDVVTAARKAQSANPDEPAEP